MLTLPTSSLDFCVLYPIKGISVISTCSWIFLLHFLPSGNSLEILRTFFVVAKLHVV